MHDEEIMRSLSYSTKPKHQLKSSVVLFLDTVKWQHGNNTAMLNIWLMSDFEIKLWDVVWESFREKWSHIKKRFDCSSCIWSWEWNWGFPWMITGTIMVPSCDNLPELVGSGTKWMKFGTGPCSHGFPGMKVFKFHIKMKYISNAPTDNTALGQVEAWH